MNSIKKGSIVKIKNEFCSKEEIGMLIAPVSSKLLIPGTESVPTHMLLNN